MKQLAVKLVVNALAAVAIFWLGQHNVVLPGLVLILGLHGRKLLEGRRLQTERWLGVMPTTVLAVSVLLLVALNPKMLAQLGWATLYWAWASFGGVVAVHRFGRLGMSVISEFSGITAMLLGAAVWHWPTYAVMIGAWIISYVSAAYWLELEATPAKASLAAAWALITAECVWVFSVWLVNYILLGGIIIIPQAAVVLTVLGYCFGSIAIAQSAGRLSRGRLAEYIAIGLAVVLIVIYGTNWKGTI